MNRILLTEKEWEVLYELLTIAIADLRMEIANTDETANHDKLYTKKRTLTNLMSKLEAPAVLLKDEG